MGDMKTATVQTRIEPRLKRSAERILDRLGLSPSQVVNLLYRQIVLRRGLPFTVEQPNEKTRAAIRQAAAGQGVRRFSSLRDLLADLEE